MTVARYDQAFGWPLQALVCYSGHFRRCLAGSQHDIAPCGRILRQQRRQDCARQTLGDADIEKAY